MENEPTFSRENGNITKNFLLEGPKLVLPEEEKKQMSETRFSFSSNTRRYYLGHKEGKPFFIVEYFDSLPDELSDEEKSKFTKEIRKQDNAERMVYILKYGAVPELKEKPKETSPNKSREYRVAQPRDFEIEMINNFVANNANKQIVVEILEKHIKLSLEEILQIVEQAFEAYRRQDYEAIHTISNRLPKEVIEIVRNEIRKRMFPKPQEIEITQLIEILKNKKVLFYTGAGISMASGVYDMNQLQKNLGIEMSKKVDDFLKRAINNP
jgi:hypothetical protein